jgi:prepilin-type N-terminal cleavage/methylation domain-containing protein
MPVSQRTIPSLPLRPCRPKSASQQGFTLLEVLLATVLISLILAGVVDLFLTSSKLTVRANAIANTGLSSANAVQQIMKDTREAEAMRLPSDAAFLPLPGYSNVSTSYEASANNQTVLTALELNVPPMQTQSVYDSGGHSITLDGTAGSKIIYDRTSLNSDWILFYRGDANQAPDPFSGQFLWKYQHSTGAITPVCRSVATKAADAVQFIQPNGVNTEIAVKVVSSEYSLVNGQQTNEESDGTTTSALSGKCVLMRDNGLGVINSAGSDTCNHAFQHN